MILPRLTAPTGSAFTLVEMLVGLAIGSVTLAGLGVASVSLQRSFTAADYQMTAQNDQLRVLDYLSRDLRMASTVTVLNVGTKVTLTFPAASPTLLNLNLGPLTGSLGLALTGNTAASSSANAAPGPVSYYLEGGQVLRDTGGAQTVLADTVDDLEFIRAGSYLTTSVLFTPRFLMNPTAGAQASTRANSCVYLRNAAPVAN